MKVAIELVHIVRGPTFFAKEGLDAKPTRATLENKRLFAFDGIRVVGGECDGYVHHRSFTLVSEQGEQRIRLLAC